MNSARLMPLLADDELRQDDLIGFLRSWMFLPSVLNGHRGSALMLVYKENARFLCLQAGTVSLATSKRYTRAVLPPAGLACSSSGTPARISQDFGDWGNVDLLCG